MRSKRIWTRALVLAGGLRRGGIAVVAIVLLVALTAGLAVLLNQRSTDRQVISNTAGVSTLPPGNYPLLDTTTALSQTVGGYTVTLGPLPQFNRAADAAAVILPYKVANSQGILFSTSAVRLVDSNGQNAPQLVAEGEQDLPWLGTTEQSYNRPGTGNVRGYPVMVFDASTLQSGQGTQIMQLTVTLQISDIYSSQQPGKMIPTPTGHSTATTSASGGPPPIPLVPAGPFVFRFRLPIDPLRSVANVNQTVTANGIPLSLEQVLATSWETRLIMKFPSPDGGPVTRWEPTDALLSGAGIERVTVGSLRSWLHGMPGVQDQHRVDGWLDNGRWAGSAFQFIGSSDSMAGGSWILVVGALTTSGSPDAIGSPTAQRIVGPWVFHFTMPPFEPRPTPFPPGTPAPGIVFPPPPPTSATHEPFATVPLPGPIVTAPAQTGQDVASATPRPTIVPMSVETVETLATAVAAYGTAYVVAPYDTPLPTPGDGASAPLQLGNLHSLTLDPNLANEDLDATNPPALSPQGDMMLVGTRDHRLLLASLDGTAFIKLADDVTGYAWSADGLYVVYLHMEPMGSPAYVQVAYSVTRDGKKRQRLDFESSNLSVFPEVTRGGAWELRSGTWLWRVPLDGSQAEKVLSVPDADYGNSFRIAPDEGRMAYPCRGATSGSSGGLCLQNADGSNWMRLDIRPYDMAWSLDSSTLAVSAGRDIVLIARDGTLLRKVTLDSIQEDVVLHWAAGSRYLLASVGSVVQTGQQRLEEIDASTGQVWAGPVPDWARSFSADPDGQHLIVRGGAAELWIADLVAR